MLDALIHTYRVGDNNQRVNTAVHPLESHGAPRITQFPQVKNCNERNRDETRPCAGIALRASMRDNYSAIYNFQV